MTKEQINKLRLETVMLSHGSTATEPPVGSGIGVSRFVIRPCARRAFKTERRPWPTVVSNGR